MTRKYCATQCENNGFETGTLDRCPGCFIIATDEEIGSLFACPSSQFKRVYKTTFAYLFYMKQGLTLKFDYVYKTSFTHFIKIMVIQYNLDSNFHCLGSNLIFTIRACFIWNNVLFARKQIWFIWVYESTNNYEILILHCNAVGYVLQCSPLLTVQHLAYSPLQVFPICMLPFHSVPQLNFNNLSFSSVSFLSLHFGPSHP